MVIKDGYDKNEKFVLQMKSIAREMSKKLFNGKPVDVHLCDKHLKPLRSIPWVEPKATKKTPTPKKTSKK